MKKRILGFALLALAMGVSACGGDDSSSKTTTKAGTGGGGSGGSGAVLCAKETCTVPDSLAPAEACCMDPFNGGCGIKSGSSCRALPKSMDTRCPVPSLGAGIMIPGAGGSGDLTAGIVAVGCCTDKNECGIDIGMGCNSTSSLCSYVPKALVSSLSAMTCDGMAIDLPADCGTNFSFPGSGGSGAAGSGS